MYLNMEEIINAVCVNMAMRKQVQPTDVQVELCWDEEHGFTAEVGIQGRQQYLVEANLLEAIEQYMYKEYKQRVFRHQLRLKIDDEIWAEVQLDTGQSSS